MAIKSDAQRRSVAKYNANNYETVLLRIKKGKKEIIQAHTVQMGESVNGFINRAIDHEMERDNTAPAAEKESEG